MVAREVFLSRGIRATTAEVAEKASVSEGSIFNRFKTKENLFREAMQISEDDIPGMLLGVIEGMEKSDIEAGLSHLADGLLEVGRIALPLMMMSWSNPQNCGGPMKRNAEKFRMFIKALASYFESHIASGQLRNVDSEILARVFLGSMHHYCMTRMFADEVGIDVIPEKIFKRGLIDLLVNGALSRGEATSSPYARRLE